MENPEQLSIEIQFGGTDVNFERDDLQALSDAYTRSVYPEEWFDEMQGRTYERMGELIADLQTILLFDGDRLIGLQGWKEVGTRFDGTHIAELTLASVHGDYRGQSLGSILKCAVEQKIEQFYGKRPFVVVGVSRTPQVVQSALNRGYYSVDLKPFFEVNGDVRIEDLDEMQELGFTAFELSMKTVHPHLQAWRERVKSKASKIVKNHSVL